MARLVTDEELAGLKQKDARAKKLSLTILGDRVELVVRPASLFEYEAFKELSNNSDPLKSKDARKQLLIFCLMSPDPKTQQKDLNQIIAQYPGIPDTAFPSLGKLVGLGAEVELGE